MYSSGMRAERKILATGRGRYVLASRIESTKAERISASTSSKPVALSIKVRERMEHFTDSRIFSRHCVAM
jgi:hypothetical protein